MVAFEGVHANKLYGSLDLASARPRELAEPFVIKFPLLWSHPQTRWSADCSLQTRGDFEIRHCKSNDLRRRQKEPF